LKEVRQVLGMFNLGLTSTQLDRLTGQIFSQARSRANEGNEAGSEAPPDEGAVRLNVQDFLGTFTVVYKHSSSSAGSGPTMDDFAKKALNAIGNLMLKTPADKIVSDLEKAAVKIQKCMRGNIARKEVEKKKNGEEGEVAKCSSSRRSSAKGGPQGSAAGDAPVTTLQNSKMVAIFKAMDASGDGMLQTEEFVQGLMMLPDIQSVEVDGKPLTQERLSEVAKAVDSCGNGNGTINYLEFLQAFGSTEEGCVDIANTLGEDITTVLFRHRLAIRMGCQYLDEEGSGKVKSEDFDTVLHGVNSVLARPERMLTNTQISLLVEALKEDDDGEDTVDYDAFLRSFVILDTSNNRAVVKRF